MITIKLGERVKELRLRLDLTQAEFAERIPGKCNYSYIGKIERDQQNPSLKLVEKISEAYSIPLGYFFSDKVFSVCNLEQDLDRLIEEHIRLTLEMYQKLTELREKIKERGNNEP